MLLTSPVTVVLVGILGGILTELLHWWNLRTQIDLPHYKSSVFYWAITLAMVLVGGLLAWLYFGSNAEAIIVLHIGISTPLILQKMVSSVPDSARGANRVFTEPKPTIKKFFTW